MMRRHFKSFCYLDLFTGSGSNLIKETGDVIIDSAIVAVKWAYSPDSFSKYIYIERDEEKVRSLRRKLIKLGLNSDRYVVEKGDCNSKVPNMLS